MLLRLTISLSFSDLLLAISSFSPLPCASCPPHHQQPLPRVFLSNLYSDVLPHRANSHPADEPELVMQVEKAQGRSKVVA